MNNFVPADNSYTKYNFSLINICKSIMYLNKLKYYCFFFVILSSCQPSLSSNVHVQISPYGIGKGVRRFTRRPTPIIYKDGGKKNCRSHPFKMRDIRRILREEESLEESAIEKLFGEKKDQETENQPQKDEAIQVEVGDYWLELGLFISNKNKGDKKNFYLLIRNITYVATANYRGEFFQHSGNIDAGYCSGEGSSGETSPFLYFIPPGTDIEYQPLSKNPFWNLTLYISGFPAIDRTGKPSSGQQSAQGGGASQSGKTYGRNELLVIPSYRVELTLIGYFVTKSGATYADFVKRIRFDTISFIR